MKGIDHFAGACVGGIMEQKRNQTGGGAGSERHGKGRQKVLTQLPATGQ